MTVVISTSPITANVNIPRRNIINQFLATATATIGLFGLGTVLAWSSPALPDMVREKEGHFYNATTEQQSWIGSIATLGALASSPIAGFTVERIGRKGSMILYSFPFIVGWIVVAFANNILILCVGRFITGFCGGSFSLCVPLYIGESVSTNIRGMLLNSLQLMMVTGILLTYVLGTYVPWKTLTLISSAFPAVFLIFAPFIPESPMFLKKVGQLKASEEAEEWFQGPLHLRKQQQQNTQEGTGNESRPKNVEENEDDKPILSYRDLLKPGVLKPLLISLALMILGEASAFNVVIFYCVDIFAKAGTGPSEYWSSIIVAIVQVLATVVSTFLVDRVGRRPLLIISELVMGLSFVALGLFFYVKKIELDEIPQGLGFLPLTSVLVFIIAFSIGIGPLSLTVMGEILHPDVRGLCAAISTSVVWLSAFAVTKIYQTMLDNMGIDYSFWSFASFSLFGTLVVLWCVPETKGKSLEEIQREFTSKSKKVMKVKVKEIVGLHYKVKEIP